MLWEGVILSTILLCSQSMFHIKFILFPEFKSEQTPMPYPKSKQNSQYALWALGEINAVHARPWVQGQR